MYLDKYGLIVQQNLDGGDSAQRMGFYWFGQQSNVAILGSSDQAVNPAIAMPAELGGIIDPTGVGGWFRNPVQYNDPTDFSRDQQFPLSTILPSSEVRGMIWNHVKRLGRYQNADVLTPSAVASYVRTLGLGWWLYPILLLLDLGTVVGAIMDVYNGYQSQDNVDINNSVVLHLLNYRFQATPFSWLARKLFSTFLPANYGNTQLGESSHVMGALAWYHRAASGGNPELAELYRPLVEKLFVL